MSEEGGEGASRVIDLAAGWDAFTYDNLLPPDLAAAVEPINKEDPADALMATLIFLLGCAGLLKLGNRVKCSARYSVPMNHLSSSKFNGFVQDRSHHQEHLVSSVTVVRIPHGLALEQLHRVSLLLAAVAMPF